MVLPQESCEGETSAASDQVATQSSGTRLDRGTTCFYSTLKALNGLSTEVTSNVCLSPKEILLNILKLTEAHNINNSVFVGMCKLVNSMFSDPILPDTQFKLDELILKACGMNYHFYCCKCQKLLRATDLTGVITCNKCRTQNDISDMTKASFFVTFDIATQLEMLFKDPSVCALLLNPKFYAHVGEGMNDLYSGKVYQLFLASLDPSDLAQHISTVLCADGSPLFKSSVLEIWPLIASVNELPPLQRMKNPILLGLWFGRGKPNFKTFLKPIRRSIVHLSKNGTTINMGGKKTFIKVDVIGCCVDAAVRGTIQGIHLHNGECGCSWCDHPGETEGFGSSARKYKYLEVPPTLRTHENLVRNAEAVKQLPPVPRSAPKPHINGVLGLSPLLKFPRFNIVDGIVLDSMHNFFLGTTRQFCRLWFGHEGNLKLPDNTFPGYYIGSPTIEARVNERIKLLTPPIELRRLPRPISDLPHFKSRELENFVLYFLVPVLSKILPDKYLRHFILYVQGIYLLMKDVVLEEDLDASDTLLDSFVKRIDKLYRNPNFSEHKHCTYNVHISLHAVNNVRNWGPAWAVNCYPYENGIGILKECVHANRGIPDQVSRALCKSNLRQLLDVEIKSARCASFAQSISSNKSSNVVFVGNVKVFGLSEDLHPNPEEDYLLKQSSLKADDFSVARKIIYNNCVFAPRTKSIKTRNDFVQLTDGSIAQLKKVIVSEKLEVVLLFYSVVHVTPSPIHLLPLLSISSPYMFTVNLIEQELFLIAHHTLRKPCVYSDLRKVGGYETISVMANTFNTV